MTLKTILKYLDAISPFELQESWDNSGLIVGSLDQEISTVLLSIDIDQALIDEAPQDSLLIVHHPLIFQGLKQLDFNSYPANYIKQLMAKNISVVALHTNFDKTHLNRYVLEDVLGFSMTQKSDYIAYVDIDMSFETLLEHISSTLHMPTVKYTATSKPLKRLAFCTGSGASMLAHIDADVFLTGDIKYHDAMHAKALNMGTIDIGHFESERYFGEVLQKQLKDLPICVIISSSKNPFTYYHTKGTPQ